MSVNKMDQEGKMCWKRDGDNWQAVDHCRWHKAPPETVVVCSQVHVHGAPGYTHNATYEMAVSSLRYT
jgi:hypothetical protein